MADAPPPYSQFDGTKGPSDEHRIGFVDVPSPVKSSAPPATNPGVFMETVHYQLQTTSTGGIVPPHMAHSMSAGSVTTAAYPHQHQQPSQPEYAKPVQGQYQYPPYAVPPPHYAQPHPQYPYPPGHFSAPTGYPPQQQPIQYVMAAPAQPVPASQPNVIVVNTSNQQQQTTAVADAPTRTVYIQQKRGVNHLLHFIITLFFAPWIFVWILLCICDDS